MREHTKLGRTVGSRSQLAPYLATKGKAGVQAFQPKFLNGKGFTDKKKGSYKEQHRLFL